MKWFIFFVLFIFVAIPYIALFDYVLFKKFLKCSRCGYEDKNIFSYLVPTFIEVLLFIGGVGIGVLLK